LYPIPKIKSEEIDMTVVPKVEPEAVSDATTNPTSPSELASDRKRQSVDPSQSQPVLEQVPPSRASTLFVVALIAAVATVAGLIIWASLVTFCRC
jgi:heme-binding NEAT domain protein